MKKYISLSKAAERSFYNEGEWTFLAEQGLVDANEHEDGWYICESELSHQFDPAVFKTPPGKNLKRPSRATAHGLAGLLLIISVMGVALASQSSGVMPRLAFLNSRLISSALVSLVVDTTTPATSTASTVPAELPQDGIISNSWNSLLETIQYLEERVSTNWQNFLGLSSSAPTPITNSTYDNPVASSTELQKLIDQRVNLSLQAILKNPSTSRNGGSGTPNGIVVVPTSGDPATDEIVRTRIQNAFSDSVRVQFDRSGETGIITPVFQKIPNDNYLFLVTPIRQR